MTLRQVLKTTAFLLLIPASPTWADADAEREALARLVHEIDALALLIQRAELHADPDARIRFRYDWLQQDLDQLRTGIQAHIDGPRATPRSFPPLRGDYRR